MDRKIAFKSYCWSIGTTSYRTENFNQSIERQLQLLHDFWQLPQNQGQRWSGNESLQKSYYDYLQSNNFVKGNAPRPCKDAREKTSGLRDIGLIDDDRLLTAAGHCCSRRLQNGQSARTA